MDTALVKEFSEKASRIKTQFGRLENLTLRYFYRAKDDATKQAIETENERQFRRITENRKG